MIFYWAINLLRRMAWLFKLPGPQEIARIDRNSPCPICGARAGRLRCVWELGPGPKAPKELPPNYKVQCQHTCNECGGRWFEAPVVKVDPTRVLPSVARDEIEKAEDRAQMLQSQAQ
jgi:hypothetical protein